MPGGARRCPAAAGGGRRRPAVSDGARSSPRVGAAAGSAPARVRRLLRHPREVALRIVFAGTPDPAVPSLRALLASGHEVVAVVTRPDAPTGRGRRTVPSPVARVAADAGLPLLQPASARTAAFRDELAGLAPDAAAVVAYGAILPRPVLDVPRHGWVNLHFSLLPAWRGAAPVQAAVRAGDPITGASTFRLEEGLDTGPVYGTVTEPVGPRDTAGDLLGRLAVSGAALLVATLDALADGSARPVPQPADGVSLAPKIALTDARVRWAEPAFAVDRAVRSVTPEPGAWTGSAWGRLVLGPVLPTDVTGLAPGELRVERRRVLAGTGTTAVELGSVLAPGRRSMPAADWARGVRPEPGTVLGRGDDEGPADPTAVRGAGAVSAAETGTGTGIGTGTGSGPAPSAVPTDGPAGGR
ncbi:hypothetical protein GCM10011594_21640 [Nakamurella endophytica]|uniref:Methionyl-tRNA formyltransferase n=1 Tax=Nakamurella endophytica TaxID=1748367 RepID=A0A917SVW7_9ACTN|nr:methionyl-tRNA formyltransferase [Nakamurella endophytica]GGM01234.1 hypothetical protein GCM10011594_21640 [Nakamurella endophytica]